MRNIVVIPWLFTKIGPPINQRCILSLQKASQFKTSFWSLLKNLILWIKKDQCLWTVFTTNSGSLVSSLWYWAPWLPISAPNGGSSRCLCSVLIFTIKLICGVSLALGGMDDKIGTIVTLCLDVILGMLFGCFLSLNQPIMIDILSFSCSFYSRVFLFVIICWCTGGKWNAVWGYYTLFVIFGWAPLEASREENWLWWSTLRSSAHTFSCVPGRSSFQVITQVKLS